MQALAVLEVFKSFDGTWEAFEADLAASEDLDLVESLDHYPHELAFVRIGGALRHITVYRFAEEGGLVTFDDAYGAS